MLKVVIFAILCFTIGVSFAQKMDSTVKSVSFPVQEVSRVVKTEFPEDMGALRVSSDHLYFGTITNEKHVSKTFLLYNQSFRDIKLKSEVEAHPHVSVEFDSLVIAPGKTRAMIVTLNPQIADQLGYQVSGLKIFTNEPDSVKEFFVVSTIQEFFPQASEASVPRLSFNQTHYDFGLVNEGDSIAATFTLVNNGLKPLNIRDAKTNCPCMGVLLPKNDIAPGQSLNMVVYFLTEGRVGQQYKNVTIFSNDPARSTQMLTIKVKVRD